MKYNGMIKLKHIKHKTIFSMTRLLAFDIHRVMILENNNNKPVGRATVARLANKLNPNHMKKGILHL